MKIEQIRKDLFKMPNTYCLVHCISSDYALGAGIAVEFNKKYNMSHKLKEIGNGIYPDCLFIDNVFNLVTKKIIGTNPPMMTFTNLYL